MALLEFDQGVRIMIIRGGYKDLSLLIFIRSINIDTINCNKGETITTAINVTIFRGEKITSTKFRY